MGQSLADLLGPALAAAQAGEAASVTAEGENEDGRAASDTTAADDPLWLALREALSVATGVDPALIDEDWDLEAEGDLHPIARYGVVARVESELKLRTRDAQVDAARTAGQLRDCFKEI